MAHWQGDQLVSDGLDQQAAQEIREKGLLTRVNRVLIPQGYIVLYTYDPKAVGQPDALRGVTLERFAPKDEAQKGVAG